MITEHGFNLESILSLFHTSPFKEKAQEEAAEEAGVESTNHG